MAPGGSRASSSPVVVTPKVTAVRSESLARAQGPVGGAAASSSSSSCCYCCCCLHPRPLLHRPGFDFPVGLDDSLFASCTCLRQRSSQQPSSQQHSSCSAARISPPRSCPLDCAALKNALPAALPAAPPALLVDPSMFTDFPSFEEFTLRPPALPPGSVAHSPCQGLPDGFAGFAGLETFAFVDNGASSFINHGNRQARLSSPSLHMAFCADDSFGGPDVIAGSHVFPSRMLGTELAVALAESESPSAFAALPILAALPPIPDFALHVVAPGAPPMRTRLRSKALKKSNSCATLNITVAPCSSRLVDIVRLVAKAVLLLIKDAHKKHCLISHAVFCENAYPLAVNTKKMQKNPHLAVDDYHCLPKEEEIHIFLYTVMNHVDATSEIPIFALIYLERLLRMTNYTIRTENWKRMLLSCSMTASKFWDDYAIFISDYLVLFPATTLDDLKRLERIFLNLVDHGLNVSKREYLEYSLALSDLLSEANKAKPLARREGLESNIVRRASTILSPSFFSLIPEKPLAPNSYPEAKADIMKFCKAQKKPSSFNDAYVKCLECQARDDDSCCLLCEPPDCPADVAAPASLYMMCDENDNEQEEQEKEEEKRNPFSTKTAGHRLKSKISHALGQADANPSNECFNAPATAAVAPNKTVKKKATIRRIQSDTFFNDTRPAAMHF